MALLKWQTSEAERFTGRKEQAKADNGTLVFNPDGTPKMKRVTETVKYEHPVILPLSVHSVQELVPLLEEIVTSGKTGFDKLAGIIEHINYGFQKNLARALNQGHSIQYTPDQQKMINSFRGMVTKGFMGALECASILESKGIAEGLSAMGFAVENLDAEGYLVQR